MIFNAIDDALSSSIYKYPFSLQIASFIRNLAVSITISKGKGKILFNPKTSIFAPL
jgi:hypothetical protein